LSAAVAAAWPIVEMPEPIWPCMLVIAAIIGRGPPAKPTLQPVIA